MGTSSIVLRVGLLVVIALGSFECDAMSAGKKIALQDATEALLRRDPQFKDPKTRIEVVKNLDQLENGPWASESITKSAGAWAAEIRQKYHLLKTTPKQQPEPKKESPGKTPKKEEQSGKLSPADFLRIKQTTVRLLAKDPEFKDPKTKAEALKNIEEAENEQLWTSPITAHEARVWADAIRNKHGLSENFFEHLKKLGGEYEDALGQLFEVNTQLLANLNQPFQTYHLEHWIHEFEFKMKRKDGVKFAKIMREIEQKLGTLSFMDKLGLYYPRLVSKYNGLQELTRYAAKTSDEKKDAELMIGKADRALKEAADRDIQGLNMAARFILLRDAAINQFKMKETEL